MFSTLPGQRRNLRGLPILLTMQENPAATRWTLADLVVRVRCKQCRGKAVTIHLAENHRAPSPRVGGPNLGWELLLHGELPGATSPHA